MIENKPKSKERKYCECDPVYTNTFREYFDVFDFDGNVVAQASEVICLNCHLPQKGSYWKKLIKSLDDKGKEPALRKETFWEKSPLMKKFHAFKLDSAVSLCGHWFMGFKTVADDLDILPLEEQESAKCRACMKRVSK